MSKKKVRGIEARTFGDYISVPSSRVKMFKKNVQAIKHGFIIPWAFFLDIMTLENGTDKESQNTGAKPKYAA